MHEKSARLSGRKMDCQRPANGEPEPGALNPPQTASWWPEDALHRHPVSRVYMCDRPKEPPDRHVQSFPQLEVALKGCHETEVQMGGLAVTLRLKPGSALFVPPYCVNRPTWRRPAQVMSLVFGNGRLDINLVNNDTPTQRGLKV